MSDPIVFELCAETLSAALAAAPGGADRIEICVSLNVGGLTPPRDLITQAIKKSGLPVHVLIRPHDRGYVYTEEEFSVISTDIEFCHKAGAAGVVLGVLTPSNQIDLPRTRALVSLAGTMEVTFHRAFDAAPSLDQALEDVIASGCHRILTSGGRPDVWAGAEALTRLVKQAGSRIAIACGGGLRLDNAAALRRTTHATQFHSSLAANGSSESLEDRIRSMIQILNEA